MGLRDKLILLRKEKGLSQADLAETLHVSRQAISRWEVGASVPSMENLSALSRLYNVSVDSLICADNNVETIAEEQVNNKEKEEANIKNSHSDYKKNRMLFAMLAIMVFAVVIVSFIVFFQKDIKKKESSETKEVTSLESDELEQSQFEEGKIIIAD